MSSDLKSLPLSAQVPTIQEVVEAVDEAVRPITCAVEGNPISPSCANFTTTVTTPCVVACGAYADIACICEISACCVSTPTVFTDKLCGSGGIYSLDNDSTSGVVRFKDLPTGGSGSTDDSNVSYCLSEHTRCAGNPHVVTAAQVGAYTKAETDQRITEAVGDPSYVSTCTVTATCVSAACVNATYVYASCVFADCVVSRYSYGCCGEFVELCVGSRLRLQSYAHISKDTSDPFYFSNTCAGGQRTIQLNPDDNEIRFDNGSTALKSTDIGNTVQAKLGDTDTLTIGSLVTDQLEFKDGSTALKSTAVGDTVMEHFTTGSGLIMNSNRVLSVTASGGGVPSGAELEPVLRGESGCMWAVALGHGACAPTDAPSGSPEEVAECYYGPVALGPDASAKCGGLSVGVCSKSCGLTVAVGEHAVAYGCGTAALGPYAEAYGSNSFAIGSEVKAGCATCIAASRGVGVIGARAQGHGSGTIAIAPLHPSYGSGGGICFGMVLRADVDGRRGGVSFYNKYLADDVTDCFTVSYGQLKSALTGSGGNYLTLPESFPDSWPGTQDSSCLFNRTYALTFYGGHDGVSTTFCSDVNGFLACRVTAIACSGGALLYTNAYAHESASNGGPVGGNGWRMVLLPYGTEVGYAGNDATVERLATESYVQSYYNVMAVSDNSVQALEDRVSALESQISTLSAAVNSL